jgi:hypothetical protein
MGAMGAIMDPAAQQSRLVRELGAEGMPPLWQYFRRLRKAGRWRSGFLESSR